MAKCEDLPTKAYQNGTTFSIWYGGYERAVKEAKEKGNTLARQVLSVHNKDVCSKGECEGTWVGCKCHPEEFFPHSYACAASGTFKIVLRTDKSYKTWFGGHGGDYAVGVEGECKCECVIPTDIGKPFDFLGLVNVVVGGLKGGGKAPEIAKDIADLIKRMQENLK